MAEFKENSLAAIEFKEADRLLPMNNVTRIMRQSLPDGVKISSEVKDRMLEATSELIGFLTNNAVEEYMLPSKRKTLSQDDLIKSLIQLDLNIFVPALNAYLKNKNSFPTNKQKMSMKNRNNNTINNDNSDDHNHNHNHNERQQDDQSHPKQSDM